MKKFLFLTSLICSVMLFSPSQIEAQRSRTSSVAVSNFEGPRNTFFVELLGNGLIFSANYDIRLVNKFGARFGLGYIGADGSGILTIPVMGNFLLGNNGKYFEVGGGICYLSGTGEVFDFDDNSAVLGTLSFMYRSQPINGGFMWKIGLTPLFNSTGFVPYWGGLGIGYCW
ncbi:MAG: hypothetical protein R2774_04750 [Saprospiraceae bacterium]